MADQVPLLHADGEELQTLRNNVKVIVQLVTDQVQNAFDGDTLDDNNAQGVMAITNEVPMATVKHVLCMGGFGRAITNKTR
jgi:hypothetical protein